MDEVKFFKAVKKILDVFKALAKKSVIIALSIYTFIYLLFSILPPWRTGSWIESVPPELIKIFILILLAYISPRKAKNLLDYSSFKVDFKKVLIISSVWLVPILLILWLAKNLSFFNLFMNVISLSTLFFIAFRLRHNMLIRLFLLAFALFFFLAIAIFTDPLFLIACIALLCACLLIFAYIKVPIKTKVIISLVFCAGLFYSYYDLNYALLLFAIIFFVCSAIFFIYATKVSKLSFSNKALDTAAFGCNIIALLSVLSALNFIIFSPTSRAQASIVKLQKGSFILLSPKDMAYGIRLAYPEDDNKWLAIIHDFKFKSQDKKEHNKGLLLTMLDENGKIIKEPMSVGRIDYIPRLNGAPNLIFVLGLGGDSACLFDINSWEVIVCTQDEWREGHVAISQDDRFIVLYDDKLITTPQFYKLSESEGEKLILALDNSELQKENCCAGNSLKFLDNRLLIHDSKVRIEKSTKSGIFKTYYQTFYVIEFLGDKPKIIDRIKDYNTYKLTYNFAHLPDEKETIYAPVFFNPSSLGGAVEIVNLKERKVEKIASSPLMLGLRVLVYVPELDVFCGASELGLVFVIDKDLKIKKVLYGGAHIRDIYVRGSEIIFASQAGIVKFDLKAVGL